LVVFFTNTIRTRAARTQRTTRRLMMAMVITMPTIVTVDRLWVPCEYVEKLAFR
jgi:hypothetical protein